MIIRVLPIVDNNPLTTHSLTHSLTHSFATLSLALLCLCALFIGHSSATSHACACFSLSLHVSPSPLALFLSLTLSRCVHLFVHASSRLGFSLLSTPFGSSLSLSLSALDHVSSRLAPRLLTLFTNY